MNGLTTYLSKKKRSAEHLDQNQCIDLLTAEDLMVYYCIIGLLESE